MPLTFTFPMGAVSAHDGLNCAEAWQWSRSPWVCIPKNKHIFLQSRTFRSTIIGTITSLPSLLNEMPVIRSWQACSSSNGHYLGQRMHMATRNTHPYATGLMTLLSIQPLDGYSLKMHMSLMRCTSNLLIDALLLCMQPPLISPEQQTATHPDGVHIEWVIHRLVCSNLPAMQVRELSPRTRSKHACKARKQAPSQRVDRLTSTGHAETAS